MEWATNCCAQIFFWRANQLTDVVLWCGFVILGGRKKGVNESSLQADIDYACGLGGANCLPIQPGMPCYLPNTRFSHASYAINSYYQEDTNAPEACDFEGTAIITTTDPSKQTSCPRQDRSFSLLALPMHICSSSEKTPKQKTRWCANVLLVFM